MTTQRSIPWTPEEDKLLTEVVATCGAKICWKDVARSVSGRSNKACRKRWSYSLNPKLRRGRWTSSEDAALLEAVKQEKRWHEVAKELPGRTGNQCANRYKEHVDPSIRHDPWTEEEDKQLWEAFQRLGNKWRAISCAVGGRPAERCRNRMKKLRRLGVARQAANDNVEPKPTPQASVSPMDPSLPDFPTPLEVSLPSTPTFEESDLSHPTPSLSPWISSTLLSEPPSSTCAMVAETFLDTPHSIAPAEEIGYLASTGGAHHASQDFPFCDASFVPGLVESDQGTFGLVADPIQTDSWGQLPSSQQIQTLTPPIQPAQSVIPPSIQGDSDLRSLLVNSYNNDPLSCSWISKCFNMVSNVSDSMTGVAFTMTCPIPRCCFQCRTVLDIWKHITLTHIQPSSKDSGIEHIVKWVLLGGLP